MCTHNVMQGFRTRTWGPTRSALNSSRLEWTRRSLERCFSSVLFFPRYFTLFFFFFHFLFYKQEPCLKGEREKEERERGRRKKKTKKKNTEKRRSMIRTSAAEVVVAAAQQQVFSLSLSLPLLIFRYYLFLSLSPNFYLL